ncbi:MAG: hypothetical protein DRP37_02805 [Thermodesulfobacteriota bacterium]|nr:MAG: hypothetical protein DRP37_02805 [Thermodesulfobacteriota bacterium]
MSMVILVQAEIDAGRPVMIHIEGHIMVGVGYDDTSGNLMYINDTWDYLDHTMIWGDTYLGMEHMGVIIVQRCLVAWAKRRGPRRI